MLVAGLLAAVVILLSQSFYQGTVQVKSSKAKTEQGTEKEAQAFISAPSDLLPSGSSVQVVETPPLLLTILETEELKTEFVQFANELTSTFLQTLFRTLIAPNAP